MISAWYWCTWGVRACALAHWHTYCHRCDSGVRCWSNCAHCFVRLCGPTVWSSLVSDLHCPKTVPSKPVIVVELVGQVSHKRALPLRLAVRWSHPAATSHKHLAGVWRTCGVLQLIITSQLTSATTSTFRVRCADVEATCARLGSNETRHKEQY